MSAVLVVGKPQCTNDQGKFWQFHNIEGAQPFIAFKTVIDKELEIVFVVIGVIGFGIFTYGYVTKVDKPPDFYPAMKE